MDGLSRITGEKAGKAYESARDAWEKFGKLISLDIPSASKLIRSFNALRNTSDAIAVYTRALDELLFAQNAESKDFFLAALQGPASEQSALSRYNVIKVDMKQRNVVPELSHYQAALKYCLAKAAVKDAVTIMKEFSLEFYGLPFQRGFITDFFTVRLIVSINGCFDLCMVFLYIDFGSLRWWQVPPRGHGVDQSYCPSR